MVRDDDVSKRNCKVQAAYAEPRLWGRFPWKGMGELHFSRCTEWPWTWDVPYIAPAIGGDYRVSGTSRVESVGPAATAQEAIAMAVAWLRPRTASVFVGTRDELASHEAETDVVDAPPGGKSASAASTDGCPTDKPAPFAGASRVLCDGREPARTRLPPVERPSTSTAGYIRSPG
jgi:hypothetical protein